MHKYPQNRRSVGSSGQTLTTNVSMTLCDSQIHHETHVLCGCTTFGTELKLGPNQYGPYAYCGLDKGVVYTRGGGVLVLSVFGSPISTTPSANQTVSALSCDNSAASLGLTVCSSPAGSCPSACETGCVAIVTICPDEAESCSSCAI